MGVKRHSCNFENELVDISRSGGGFTRCAFSGFKLESGYGLTK